MFTSARISSLCQIRFLCLFYFGIFKFKDDEIFDLGKKVATWAFDYGWDNDKEKAPNGGILYFAQKVTIILKSMLFSFFKGIF